MRILAWEKTGTRDKIRYMEDSMELCSLHYLSIEKNRVMWSLTNESKKSNKRKTWLLLNSKLHYIYLATSLGE